MAEGGRSKTASSEKKVIQYHINNNAMDTLLGYTDDNGEAKPFRLSKWKVCLHCKVKITPENDSGWQVFSPYEKGVTVPTCISCDMKVNKRFQKQEIIDIYKNPKNTVTPSMN